MGSLLARFGGDILVLRDFCAGLNIQRLLRRNRR